MKRLSANKSTLAHPNVSSASGSLASQRFIETQLSIKIPYFWGTDDYIEAADWIHLYDLISTDYNWTATNKVMRLAGYLRKHALVWYVETIKTYPVELTAWTTYKEMFSKHFAPSPLERLSSSRSSASSAASSGR